MERKVGTVSRGIRCPIIREGDNLADIVVNSVLEAGESEGFENRDRDVISVTDYGVQKRLSLCSAIPRTRWATHWYPWTR